MNILLRKLFCRLIVSLFLVGILFTAFAVLPFTALAATCTVTPGIGTYPTIQSAINDITCDPINIPADTFNENLDIDRSLTLQGAGQTSTIIDAGGSDRGVTIDGGTIVVYLNDLRITNGDATSASPRSRSGGGILVNDMVTLHGTNLQLDANIASTAVSGFGGGLALYQDAAAYITDTLVYTNTATKRNGFTGNGQGGGLYVNAAVLHLADSQILTNTAAYTAANDEFASGGGLHISANSQAYLSGNTWQGNVARSSHSESCDLSGCTSGNDHEGGGAIASSFPTGDVTLVVNDDIFIGNVANAVDPMSNDNSGRGGAIFLNTSNTGGRITATLTAVTMTQNIAAIISNGIGEEGQGGAIYARHTDLTVERAKIYNNQAAASGDGSGGGIYQREPLDEASLTIINTVLAGNTAAGNGNGAQLYVNYTNAADNNTTSVVHTTLADDTLNPKEALFYNGPDASDSLAITNTIVASHAIGIQNTNNAVGDATARYMLFFGNGDNHPSPGATAFPDMTGWVAGDPDPLFVNPAAGDYHLSSGSPAIDAGTDAGVADDIDGQPRPAGDTFDIGADEVLSTAVFLPLILK